MNSARSRARLWSLRCSPYELPLWNGEHGRRCRDIRLRHSGSIPSRPNLRPVRSPYGRGDGCGGCSSARFEPDHGLPVLHGARCRRDPGTESTPWGLHPRGAHAATRRTRPQPAAGGANRPALLGGTERRRRDDRRPQPVGCGRPGGHLGGGGPEPDRHRDGPPRLTPGYRRSPDAGFPCVSQGSPRPRVYRSGFVRCPADRT